ncbi:MAG TPA: MiaB/RimO family radical SAM methylthiotransferase [Gemmatimonadaceae bacterium]|nr:MiaB/RimO family radical SAM methylthiotransferase [Gemmatimonadaceae bacterium]
MKVYLRTFGCRANHADSEAVRAVVAGAGHQLVDAPEDADVAVFNSCAVTADAEADLRQAVRRAARRAPAIRSVVMGCVAGLADREPALLALPSVSHVVPGGDVARVADALGIAPDRAAAIGGPQQSTRALLRIQDGCDEHCTFCATTLARGANRSRPAADLVREAAALAGHHPEIVLTGVHIGTYGVDLGSSLSALLDRLLREVPDVRFRLSSVEATEVDAPLCRLLRAGGRVVPFLHAPLQSGSAAMLRRMGRHWYTPERYAEAVERVVAHRAVFGLGADVITGFPGETDRDHSATVALCERLPFTYLHVFPFSLRPGTAAERLPGRVADTVARARAAEMRALAHRKQAAYAASRAGTTADVVVLGAAGHRSGLTEDYLTVRLDDPALPRGHRFVARLRTATDGSLVAA